MIDLAGAIIAILAAFGCLINGAILGNAPTPVNMGLVGFAAFFALALELLGTDDG